MKRTYAIAMIASILLVLGALGAMTAWAAGSTATFTPPQQPGTIFAVVNADRSAGARTTKHGGGLGSVPP